VAVLWYLQRPYSKTPLLDEASEMARIRSLKPETPADKGLAAHPIEARYTFFLIIARADDYGLMLAEPRQLLGELYPHDEEITAGRLMCWVEMLVQGGHLRWRLTRDGARVLEVVNWEEHQKVKSPGQPLLQKRLIALGEEGKVMALPRELVDLPRELVCGKGEGKGKGKVAAKGGNGTAGGSWPDQAQRMYAEHIGHLPVGRVGKALAEVVKAHGWDTVRPWFLVYCKARPYQKRDGTIHGDRPGDTPDGATRDVRFCSPEEFARTLTVWRARCEPLKA
jgi:hypothetical protein